MARFSFFLTWWGLVILGFLDASLFVFIPFGTDAVVIYVCARDREWFWLYPLLRQQVRLAAQRSPTRSAPRSAMRGSRDSCPHATSNDSGCA